MRTRKRKWRLREQEDPEAYIRYDDAQGADNENLASAKELAEAVKEQLEASIVKGQAMKLTEEEAREKYGDSLVVSSLGAQVKNGAKETGDLTVRLLFDGTHGVPVNAVIRVRDQDRSPAAPVLRQLANNSGPRFGFQVDVKDAHRLYRSEWHLLFCRCEFVKKSVHQQDGNLRRSQCSVLVEPSGHCDSPWSSLLARA